LTRNAGLNSRVTGKPGIARPESIARYLVSVPERIIRSASAIAAGLVHEIGEVALPSPLRRTRIYRTFVGATLKFLIEEVGQVEGVDLGESQVARNFLLRRTAGNGLEWAGILAFRASPVWILVTLADLSGAGRDLIREIADSLKQEGLLEREGSFETVEQMLDGLERSAGKLADTINMPPLDVAELRREWLIISSHLASIPPRQLPPIEFLHRFWTRIEERAGTEHRTIFEVSSLMALSAFANLPDQALRLSRAGLLAVERTGQYFAEPVLEHYAATLDEMAEAGFFEFWLRQFRPYLRAAAANFAPHRPSLTARLFRKRSANAE
jgi:hypothetical protein